MEQQQGYSTFISHSTLDNAFVHQLANDLERHGIKTWVDEAEIRPGDDFVSRIEEGLRKATHVIIVLSPRSVISSWVKEETHAAQLRAIRGEARLIPLLLGDLNTADIPLLLRSRLYVDFRDTAKYSDEFRKLLSAFEISPVEEQNEKGEVGRELQGASADGKQIWFDQSHNQHEWDWGPIPLIYEYGYSVARKLAEKAGYRVMPLTKKIAKPEELTDCDLLVIVAPYHTHLQPLEIRELVRFVENGGSLLLMSYYTGDGHYESNLSELAQRFGVEFNHDQVEDTVHYHRYHHYIVVENVPQQPQILQGVRRLCFPLCCSLKVDAPAQVILRSGPHSFTKEAEIVDRGRIHTWKPPTKKEAPLAAISTYGAGKFAVIGTWEIFLSEYMESENFDNDRLYLNLLQWLTSTSGDD